MPNNPKQLKTGKENGTPEPAHDSIEAFFALLEADPLPENFLAERPRGCLPKRIDSNGMKKTEPKQSCE